MIKTLKKSSLFRNVPKAKLGRILKMGRTLDFQSGTRIFNKQDLAQHMFFVAHGRVRIYTSSGSKKRKTFAYLGPGAFFGEMALLDSSPRSASAEAVEDCRLLVIDKRDFRRFLLHDADLCCRLLETLGVRLRNMNEQIENLLFRNILGRIAKVLHDLSKQNGRPMNSGILLRHPYTRQELADLVGTTREPLSRGLTQLRRAQLIGFQGDRIFLRDPRRLEALIGIGDGA